MKQERLVINDPGEKYPYTCLNLEETTEKENNPLAFSSLACCAIWYVKKVLPITNGKSLKWH